MRPIGCVKQREDQDREDADESDDADDRKLTRSPRTVNGTLNGILNLRGLNGIEQPQRISATKTNE